MVANILIKHVDELNVLFDIDLVKPELVIVNTRDEFNKETNRSNTFSWMVARADIQNKKIVIFSKKSMGLETTHKKEEFDQLIKHELVHFYIEQKFGKNIPMWVHEGLACYIAGQAKKFVEASSDDIISLSSYEDFQKDKFAYSKSYHLVKRAVEKAGGLKIWLKDLKRLRI